MELLPLSKDAYWGADRLLDLATVYVHAGEPEAAVEIVDPFWDPLRQNPRFQRRLRGPET